MEVNSKVLNNCSNGLSRKPYAGGGRLLNRISLDSFNPLKPILGKEPMSSRIKFNISFKADIDIPLTKEQKIECFKNSIKPEFKKYLENFDRNNEEFDEPKLLAVAVNSYDDSVIDMFGSISLLHLNGKNAELIKDNSKVCNIFGSKLKQLIKNSNGKYMANEIFNNKIYTNSLEFFENIDEDLRERFEKKCFKIANVLCDKDFSQEEAFQKIQIMKKLDLYNFMKDEQVLRVVANSQIKPEFLYKYKKLYDKARLNPEKYAEPYETGTAKCSIEDMFKRENEILDSMDILDYETLNYAMSKTHMKFLRQTMVINNLSDENRLLYTNILSQVKKDGKGLEPWKKLDLARLIAALQDFGKSSQEISDTLYKNNFDINAVRNENELLKIHQELELDGIANPKDIVHCKITPEKLNSFNKLRIIAFKNPSRYGIGEEEALAAAYTYMCMDIRAFSILAAFNALDFDSMQLLLTKRTEQFMDYVDAVNNMQMSNKKILKDSMTAIKDSGEKLTPQDKVEMLKTLTACKNEAILNVIQEMITTNSVNISKINNLLLEDFLNTLGLNSKECKSKLLDWNTDYITSLMAEMSDHRSLFDSVDGKESFEAQLKYAYFKDVIENTLKNDFKNYIHDKSNLYGYRNELTKQEFYESGLDYSVWDNAANEIQSEALITGDGQEVVLNTEKILQNIEDLRQNAYIKSIIDKRYSNYINDGKFILPDNIVNSKSSMLKFADGFLKNLSGVFNLALKNQSASDPQKVQNAEKVLNIKHSLIDAIIALKNIKECSAPLRLKVKMWSRNPEKDLFEGHYSTCCLKLGDNNNGANNGASMPVYLLHSAINMIELVDNKNGEVIGNAVTYMAKDDENNPIMVIDNVEINNSRKGNQDYNMQFREEITLYCKKLLKKMSPDKNIKIVLGVRYNDIPTEDLTKSNVNLSFIGELGDSELYLDLPQPTEGNQGNEAEEQLSGFMPYPKDFRSYNVFELGSS